MAFLIKESWCQKVDHFFLNKKIISCVRIVAFHQQYQHNKTTVPPQKYY